MNEFETETNNLIRIFQQFGIYRNTLPKEHNEFVKMQLQKEYDTVTKTYHEDTGKFQLINMKKIRTVHNKQSQSITPSVTTEHHQNNYISNKNNKSSQNYDGGFEY